MSEELHHLQCTKCWTTYDVSKIMQMYKLGRLYYLNNYCWEEIFKNGRSFSSTDLECLVCRERGLFPSKPSKYVLQKKEAKLDWTEETISAMKNSISIALSSDTISLLTKAAE